MINWRTKFEVSNSTRYEDINAIAAVWRSGNTLVSINEVNLR